MRTAFFAGSIFSVALGALALGACSGSDDSNGNGDTQTGGDGSSSSTDSTTSSADGNTARDGQSNPSDAGKDTAVDMTKKDGGPRDGACSPAVTTTPGALTEHVKASVCGDNLLGYYDYVPPNYNNESNWPLLLAFHGDGQRGDGNADLPNILTDGLPPDITADKWDPQHRYVVLMPQMDDRDGKTDRTGTSVYNFIQFAKANYDIDPNRIYLTGFSGGGEPIYNYLGQYSGGEVAANNINAGWYSTQNDECSWKNIPIWYFHADNDTTVPPAQHTEVSLANLLACSPAPATAPRYTKYVGIGHSAWVPTYNLAGMSGTPAIVTTAPGNTPYNISIYDWFLQYSR